MDKKIMLIDGNSIINRAFYGVPLLTNAQGEYTNAVYGFFNIFFKLFDEEKPGYVAVAFDLKGPTFRHEKFAGYKGTRKGMPPELFPQLGLLQEGLRHMGIAIYSKEGYEADDILGTIAVDAEKKGYTPVVVSGDRDLLQLATDTVKIRIPKTKASGTEVYDYKKDDVLAEYGVTPTEYIDVKALMGDASDNIPGVPGIGEKTALKIIQAYHCIEEAYQHADIIKPKKASENLRQYYDQAVMSKDLATIHTGAPITIDYDAMAVKDFYTQEAYEFCKRLDFKSFLSRFQANEKKQDTERKEKVLLADAAVWKNTLNSITGETGYAILHDKGPFFCAAVYGDDICIYADNESMPTADFFAGLAAYFHEDNKKITHDAKKDFKFLRSHGIEPKGIVFDTLIAGYILKASSDHYSYDLIASEYLQEQYPSAEELLGKTTSKNRKLFSDLSEDDRRLLAVRMASVYKRAKDAMQAKLAEYGQEALYYEMEHPLLYVLADMEQYGIRINEAELSRFGGLLSGRIDELTQMIYGMAGEEFNINSTKQLGVILFEKLGLKGGKKTKTGYSTAADVLEKMLLAHPIIPLLMEYRQLTKLKSTYVDGLLMEINPQTGKIYSTFNQTIASTGRISSTEPNLQNIPIKLSLGRELRKVFIPSSEEYIFLDGDYSQIELRVLAHMSQDEKLIEAFNQGKDIHRITAAQVFGVPFEEVTGEMRASAKAVNFGIIYGMGAYSLSQDLGITRKRAEEYIEGYFRTYPRIKAFLDGLVTSAKENGYAETLFGRRREILELKSSNFARRSFGERAAMNMPIQGTAADIIKIAMVKVYRELKKGGYKSRLILQVHDELLVETHVDEKEPVGRILKEQMETAVSLAVRMETDIHEGRNWYEAK